MFQFGSQHNKETLRFVTCGSADDGKSTLIDRLLFESKSIDDDQFKALEIDSGQGDAQDKRIDEQGIAIDVACRFFATDRRRYVAADTSGHEQYTRNMATGASNADLAVILVDARRGVLTQTRRHSRIAAMMGIRHVVLAVNKMDLAGFDEAVFNAAVADYRRFAADLEFTGIQAIPVSALEGDNVLRRSSRTPWYSGPGLLEYMDIVEVPIKRDERPFRMPVQGVDRTNPDFHCFRGRVAEGTVSPGDAVRALPSGVLALVKSVIVGFDEVAEAHAGDAITLTLTGEVDAGRGDVLAAADAPLEMADQFEAKLLWMAEHPMAPGRQYLLKLHCKEVTATVTEIKYHEDVDTGARLAAKTLGLNEIGAVKLSTSAPMVFEPYRVSHALGGFILIDKLTFDTVGAGIINFALRRASNIHWQALEINKASRAAQKQQTPRCIWFTGLSGSGKSTIANALERRLHAAGKHTYLLDGDNVRHGLSRDLGFTEADRVENIRRVAEVAKLMVDAGLVVLVSFISPFRGERRLARQLFGEGEFVEVFVDTPLAECEARDTKGLYAKARRGELKNFTGIDSDYERPESPEILLETIRATADECARRIHDELW